MRLAVIGESAPAPLDGVLGREGFRVLRLPRNPRLPEPVAAHPDLSVFFAPDAIYTTAGYAALAQTELESLCRCGRGRKPLPAGYSSGRVAARRAFVLPAERHSARTDLAPRVSDGCGKAGLRKVRCSPDRRSDACKRRSVHSLRRGAGRLGNGTADRGRHRTGRLQHGIYRRRDVFCALRRVRHCLFLRRSRTLPRRREADRRHHGARNAGLRNSRRTADRCGNCFFVRMLGGRTYGTA